MVTVNKMMLSTNVLPPPMLIQMKYIQGRKKESLKSDIIIIVSRSDSAVMVMKLLFVNTHGKSEINTMRCLP